MDFVWDFPSMDSWSSSGVSGYYVPTQILWCDVRAGKRSSRIASGRTTISDVTSGKIC